MTDAEREYLHEQVGEEAYLDGMKAARKLLERWGALIYIADFGYQSQTGLYDAIQDARLGLPITE